MMDEYNRNLYNDAKPATYEKARHLRKNLTEAEDILWQELRGKKLMGFKFRRQHAFGIFILDFYCLEAKLVIELDGAVHEEKFNKLYDKARTSKLAEEKLTVIRFSNKDVLTNLPHVLAVIKDQLAGKMKH